MKVILLERVSKLGVLGDQVPVKAGFARNYLIPQGKALPATNENIKVFEHRRNELEKQAQARLNAAQKRASALEGVKIVISVQAGEEGRLFGSVTAHDISKAFSDAGHPVTKGEIFLSGPIRQVGEHEIELYLDGSEEAVKIIISVVALRI